MSSSCSLEQSRLTFATVSTPGEAAFRDAERQPAAVKRTIAETSSRTGYKKPLEVNRPGDSMQKYLRASKPKKGGLPADLAAIVATENSEMSEVSNSILMNGDKGDSALPADLAAILATETSNMPHARGQATVDNDMSMGSDSTVQQTAPSLQTRPLLQPITPATNSLTPTPPPATSFLAVNATSRRKAPRKRAAKAASKPSAKADRPLAPLAPAPSRQQQQEAYRAAAARAQAARGQGDGLLALPAEIRVEIYKLVLKKVLLHILPTESPLGKRAPHPLTRVNKLVRNEVLPIIHACCPIEAMVTDFNFSGMLEFMGRIPPQDEKALLMNNNLKIKLCTTGDQSKGMPWKEGDSVSLSRWLRKRADKYRAQPKWEYTGIWPGSKVESAIRRKISRMTEDGKRQELIKLGLAMGMARLEKPKVAAQAT